jgi:hypothetical protein
MIINVQVIMRKKSFNSQSNGRLGASSQMLADAARECVCADNVQTCNAEVHTYPCTAVGIHCNIINC